MNMFRQEAVQNIHKDIADVGGASSIAQNPVHPYQQNDAQAVPNNLQGAAGNAGEEAECESEGNENWAGDQNCPEMFRNAIARAQRSIPGNGQRQDNLAFVGWVNRLNGDTVLREVPTIPTDLVDSDGVAWHMNEFTMAEVQTMANGVPGLFLEAYQKAERENRVLSFWRSVTMGCANARLEFLRDFLYSNFDPVSEALNKLVDYQREGSGMDPNTRDFFSITWKAHIQLCREEKEYAMQLIERMGGAEAAREYGIDLPTCDESSFLTFLSNHIRDFRAATLWIQKVHEEERDTLLNAIQNAVSNARPCNRYNQRYCTEDPEVDEGVLTLRESGLDNVVDIVGTMVAEMEQN